MRTIDLTNSTLQVHEPVEIKVIFSKDHRDYLFFSDCGLVIIDAGSGKEIQIDEEDIDYLIKALEFVKEEINKYYGT